MPGKRAPGLPPSEASTQLRTILHASYRSGPFTIGGDLYDSRALDVPRPSAISTGEVDALEPVQAYLAYDFSRGERLRGRVTLGRQVANLGSRRLIANDDYRNTTNGFTGARIDLGRRDRWDVTAIYLLPQQRLPDDAAGLRQARVRVDREGFDTRLWGANATVPRLVGRLAGDIAAYRFEERDRPGRTTRDRQLTTLTARLLAPPAPGKWDGEFEVMRQTGSISASTAAVATRRPVAAWFGHAEIGYQMRGGWRPRLAVEGDYASGDDGTGSYGRFDTLFGMRRGDFAPAGLYNAVTRGNVIALGPRVEATPSTRIDAFVTAKKLWLASARDAFATTGVIDPSGRSGRDAGWQIDGRVRWWAIPKRLQLEVDGVVLGKGQFLRDAPNRTTARDTLYGSLNATAQF